jgi:hypothetical protein
MFRHLLKGLPSKISPGNEVGTLTEAKSDVNTFFYFFSAASFKISKLKTEMLSGQKRTKITTTAKCCQEKNWRLRQN